MDRTRSEIPSVPRAENARGSAESSGARTALVIALLIVALLVIIGAIGALAVRRYENYLSGLWVGDPAFLQEARLRDFQLFLAPSEGGRRQGYLIMTDEAGAFVSNQAIEVHERSPAQRWWTALRSVLQTRGDAYSAKCVSFEYDAASAEPPMPELMKMALSMADGTLALFTETKVFAFLQKDLAASAAAVEAYAS
jgi:hypothetical protein